METMMIGVLMIMLAGYIVGRWHERDKNKAVNKAFMDGKAAARQKAKTYRVQQCREALPVPGYAEAKWVDHGVEHCKIVILSQIMAKAEQTGRAVGRIQ